MMLSVCIITKNEGENLKKCLQALSAYTFEIVVVDTGSTDDTKKIAGTYTDNLYDFPWCDDFAAAKNFAISKAGNDMVMVIDSDEYLEKTDISLLQKILYGQSDKVGRIERINSVMRNGEVGSNREHINRIFDRTRYHYEGKIHEQVVPIIRKQVPEGMQEYETYVVPITIFHSGYSGDTIQREAKAARNIRMLKQEIKERGEDPYLIYQLGKSYYMDENYKDAVDCFRKALEFDLNPKLEYVIDMVESYGYALLNAGSAQTALQFENIYHEFGGTADFQFLMGFIYMNNELYENAVGEFQKATGHDNARTSGANSYLAYYNIGVIKECLGDIVGAKEFYEKCGKYEKAARRLRLI